MQGLCPSSTKPASVLRLAALSGLLRKAGDRDRTDDIQLGKLTFYH